MPPIPDHLIWYAVIWALLMSPFLLLGIVLNGKIAKISQGNTTVNNSMPLVEWVVIDMGESKETVVLTTEISRLTKNVHNYKIQLKNGAYYMVTKQCYDDVRRRLINPRMFGQK